MTLSYDILVIGQVMDVKYFKILIPLLFFYVNVYADECSYKEQANLNKEAALVQANYELKEIKLLVKVAASTIK